jgi:ADP-heptose:LPS heptosyltransferase
VNGAGAAVLVHLASGVGDVVMATPLLMALADDGFAVDVRLDADYAQTIELFRGWSVIRRIEAAAFPAPPATYAHVLPAVPPFYWCRFAGLYRGRTAAFRPPDSLFQADEQGWYMAFARALGCGGEAREYRLPVGPSERFGVSGATVVLAPGCKTGEMAAKRWPWFEELARRFDDVAVVGTGDDVGDGGFPGHCRWFVDRLSLRETAELLASAGLAVGNDSGLGHVAAAVGTPTLMLFGPTSETVLGRLPKHVKVLRSGLDCEPCWRTARLAACERRVDCLRQLSVDRVEAEMRRMQGTRG